LNKTGFLFLTALRERQGEILRKCFRGAAVRRLPAQVVYVCLTTMLLAQALLFYVCLSIKCWAEDIVPLNYVPFIMAHDAGSGYLEDRARIVGLVVSF
jgi:hypothetical protein